LPWQIVGAVVLGVSCIILLVIAYSVLSRNQVAARDRLEATLAADHALDRLQGLIVDAETAVRGYFLIGRESMLDPYNNAKKIYAEALENVERLTADDEVLRGHLEILRGLIDDKWIILDTSVERQRRLGVPQPPAATESTQDTPGKTVMDAIRNRVALMHDRETAIRETLTEAFQRAVVYTQASVFLASFLALFAIFALYWATRRYLGLRLKAEAELSASEERYRILTEVSPQIIWMADVRGEMTFATSNGSSTPGWISRRRLPPSASSVVHPDDRANVAAAWGRRYHAINPSKSRPAAPGRTTAIGGIWHGRAHARLEGKYVAVARRRCRHRRPEDGRDRPRQVQRDTGRTSRGA
jgi:CHASE3 domain sensor protein